MPFQHLYYPSTGFRDRVVHYHAQLDLDRQQLGSHPFLDRLAPVCTENLIRVDDVMESPKLAG
jgi:hypothetical protein